MKQKALLVAVNDYEGYAPRLEAPELEMEKWRQRLEAYGFTNIRTRVAPMATRQTVKGDLRWLFGGSSRNDQLVFAFFGHGRIVESHSTGGLGFEEALIHFPNGDASLRSAELTDTDIEEIIEEVGGLAEDADAMIGIDACYAAYSDTPTPQGAKALFIPPVPSFDRNIENVRAFGSLASPFKRSQERPIIIAACGREKLAYEIPINGVQRLVFSYRATEYLEQIAKNQADVTFRQLVDAIKPPQQDGVDQKPDLRGNTARENEAFPGQASSSPTIETEGHKTVPSQTTVLSLPGWVDIRIEGIACFASARMTTDPYQKRLLFPHDARVDPNVRHLTFIEIMKTDVEDYGQDRPIEYTHFGNSSIVFYRWELEGFVIQIPNRDRSQPLEVMASFESHIPRMTKVHPPYATSQYHPQSECFQPKPISRLIDAFLDLDTGILGVGPLDTEETAFYHKAGPPPTLKLLSARYATLLMPLQQSKAVVVLRRHADDYEIKIILKPGASIRIGNVRLDDIIQKPSAEDVKEHFRLYYNLAQPYPADPALPFKPLLPTNFCPPTGWP
jgi:caspase domain-containing protein